MPLIDDKSKNDEANIGYDKKNEQGESSVKNLFIPIFISFILADIIAFYFIKQKNIIESTALCFLLGAAVIAPAYMIMKAIPKKILNYLYFGGLTTLVSFASYAAISFLIFGKTEGSGGVYWAIPQGISWMLAVLFAFFTNRYFVFEGEQGKMLPELLRFFISRIGSGLVIEYGLMFVLINLSGLGELISKFICSVVVVIANYVLSRFFVFHSNNKA